MKKIFATAVLASLWGGITTQFVWKMFYFPEPLSLVIIGLVFFTLISGVAIWCISKLKGD